MVKKKNKQHNSSDIGNDERKENKVLEIKKMKQGMSYSCKEKTIILNVFKYFRHQYSDKCVTDIVRRTAKATGCSEKSIFQFRKEESSVQGFREPSKTKVRKNININSRDIKYDNTVRTVIRSIIYDLQYRNIVPSLNTILKRINDDDKMPKFSLMTLRRLMCDMGFSYQKNGNKAVLIEKPDIDMVPAQLPPQPIATTQLSPNNCCPGTLSYNHNNVVVMQTPHHAMFVDKQSIEMMPPPLRIDRKREQMIPWMHK